MSSEREIEVREQMTRHWLAVAPVVRAFVSAAISAHADRDDVVQQVALTVARRFDDYDPARPFLPWVLWLAKDRIADFHRTQGRRREVLREESLDQLAAALEHRQAEVSVRRAALDHCLTHLSQRSRALIQQRYHEGLSIAQIAAALQSTPGSVRVTLFRIRETLAECIRRTLAVEGAL